MRRIGLFIQTLKGPNYETVDRIFKGNAETEGFDLMRADPVKPSFPQPCP